MAGELVAQYRGCEVPVALEEARWMSQGGIGRRGDHAHAGKGPVALPPFRSPSGPPLPLALPRGRGWKHQHPALQNGIAKANVPRGSAAAMAQRLQPPQLQMTGFARHGAEDAAGFSEEKLDPAPRGSARAPRQGPARFLHPTTCVCGKGSDPLPPAQ